MYRPSLIIKFTFICEFNDYGQVWSCPLVKTKKQESIVMANITGTSGNDFIVGTDGSDILSGGSGSDNIRGKRGTDTIN